MSSANRANLESSIPDAPDVQRRAPPYIRPTSMHEIVGRNARAFKTARPVLEFLCYIDTIIVFFPVIALEKADWRWLCELYGVKPHKYRNKKKRCQSACNFGSDSLLMKFKRRLTLVSQRNQYHAASPTSVGLGPSRV